MPYGCNTDLSATASSMNSLPVPVAAVALVAFPLVSCSTVAKGGADGVVRATPLVSPAPPPARVLQTSTASATTYVAWYCQMLL